MARGCLGVARDALSGLNINKCHEHTLKAKGLLEGLEAGGDEEKEATIRQKMTAMRMLALIGFNCRGSSDETMATLVDQMVKDPEHLRAKILGAKVYVRLGSIHEKAEYYNSGLELLPRVVQNFLKR